MTGKVKKLVLLNLPYLIFVYLFDKLCQDVYKRQVVKYHLPLPAFLRLEL